MRSADVFRVLNQLSQCHLEGDQAEALFHIANVRGRKLLTESDLSKDIGGLSLNRYVLVYHSDLLSV